MQDRQDPSMEDILASIKKVIAEEKELRAAVRAVPPAQPDGEPEEAGTDDEILELDDAVALPPEPMAEADLGPALVSDSIADESRARIEQLQQIAAAAPPPPQVNPLEAVVRDMLRPVLKEWLDHHLPAIVDEHVKREIGRITGQRF